MSLRIAAEHLTDLIPEKQLQILRRSSSSGGQRGGMEGVGDLHMFVRQRLMCGSAASFRSRLIAHLFEGFILKNLKTHLGQSRFNILGSAYEPFLHGAAALFVMWLLLYWMYRRKLFLRI